MYNPAFLYGVFTMRYFRNCLVGFVAVGCLAMGTPSADGGSRKAFGADKKAAQAAKQTWVDRAMKVPEKGFDFRSLKFPAAAPIPGRSYGQPSRSYTQEWLNKAVAPVPPSNKRGSWLERATTPIGRSSQARQAPSTWQAPKPQRVRQQPRERAKPKIIVRQQPRERVQKSKRTPQPKVKPKPKPKPKPRPKPKTRKASEPSSGFLGFGRKKTVRTTAYTHTESDHLIYGRKNAIGTRLQYGRVKSAAADWSVFPLGTKFRISGDPSLYVVDDYGSALVGTKTIDLYKPSKRAMNHWGVRHVDIKIVRKGCFKKSYEVLRDRTRHKHVRSMIYRIKKKV